MLKEPLKHQQKQNLFFRSLVFT